MDIEQFQLFANLTALGTIGLIYAGYVKNLKSEIALKSEQITLLRSKNAALEKRTPEYVETLLSERIGIREKELKRLKDDDEAHRNEIRARNTELDLSLIHI